MVLVDNFWSIAYYFFMNKYYAMLVFFHSLREHSLLKQFLNRIARGFETEEAHGFIIRIDTSSSPLAFLRSNDLITIAISSKKVSKKDSNSWVWKVIFARIDLLFAIFTYCRTLLAKVIIEQICFYQKSYVDYLLTTELWVKPSYHLHMKLIFPNMFLRLFWDR